LIRALVNICKANPCIINGDNPQIIAQESNDVASQYVRNLNMRKYKIPGAIGQNRRYAAFASMFSNAMFPRVISNDMWNPIVGGHMQNSLFVNPYNAGLPMMMGGGYGGTRNMKGGNLVGIAASHPNLPSRGTGFDHINKQTDFLKNGSASIFYNTFSALTSAMGDVGMKLHPDDKARISNAIGQIEKYEDTLAELCVVLNNIVKLARFYGVSLENIDKDTSVTLNLSQIQSWDDIKSFVRNYARDLTQTMTKNLTIQQSTGYDLMTKIVPRYFNDCDGNTGSQSQRTSTPARKDRIRL